mmetsp:Transcript_20256/g.26171  ORF Transcript_20256/g.26171 Transcript_20256/m.26171 type:complete len:110 (-) Transcript_20256:1219-1548(-)
MVPDSSKLGGAKGSSTSMVGSEILSPDLKTEVKFEAVKRDSKFEVLRGDGSSEPQDCSCDAESKDLLRNLRILLVGLHAELLAQESLTALARVETISIAFLAFRAARRP